MHFFHKCLSFEGDFIASNPCAAAKFYFKKRKTNLSIDDDRTVVGKTVKLILTPCVAGLGIFFLTSEYTVLCEGSLS